jgi:spermidine synthase
MKRHAPAFILGFAATSFQIYLLREFSAVFYGNELNYGFVLASWLLWGGAGSLALGRLVRRSRLALPGLYVGIGCLFTAALFILRFAHRILGLVPGEATGMLPSLAFSVALALLVSFPLGAAFVVNAACLGGDSSRVYVLESLGAAAAGVIVHFVLIPLFSNWRGAGLVFASLAVLILSTMRPKRPGLLAAAAAASAALLIAADFPVQASAWQPFRLVRSRDTHYGKLQVFSEGGQVMFSSNGLPMFSYPNREAAEEAVHFVMLQRPGAERVLLIGGSVSGAAAEILKYPVIRLDCVELDPVVIELAKRHLPPAALAGIEDRRTRVFFSDGRAFIKGASAGYDVVILCVPEPATAQINRFFTVEFFLEVKRKLGPDGVLGFVVPSSENYISPDLERLLSSILASLRTAFPATRVVPGSNNVFLASDSGISVDPEFLAARLRESGLQSGYFRPEMLRARLNAFRLGYLESRLAPQSARLNRDLVPASYYYHSILWASQFPGPEASLLRSFAAAGKGALLDAPFVALAMLTGAAVLARRRSSLVYLTPVAVMGMTSIVLEIAMIMVFQSFFGYVYSRVSLLLGCFMAGLFIGAVATLARRGRGLLDLAGVQAMIVALLLLVDLSFERPARIFEPFLFLLAAGAASGALFITANKLTAGSNPHPGLAYGIDLIGSFAGALVASSVIIPLWGVSALIGRLAGLNAACLFFLLLSWLRNRRSGTQPAGA